MVIEHEMNHAQTLEKYQVSCQHFNGRAVLGAEVFAVWHPGEERFATF